MAKNQIPEDERKFLQIISKAMEDTKADEPQFLILKELGAFTDYLAIAGATSDRQVNAIADRIVFEVKKEMGQRPIGIEGARLGQWVLIDYGWVVCHVFLNEMREFYRLEEMWSDADPLSLSLTKKVAKPTKKPAKVPAVKTTKTIASKKPAKAAATKKKSVKKSVKKPVKKPTKKIAAKPVKKTKPKKVLKKK